MKVVVAVAAILAGAMGLAANYSSSTASTERVTIVSAPSSSSTFTLASAPASTSSSASNDWFHCAFENETCFVSGPTQVRYGAGDQFFVQDVASQVVCNNGVFGDPVPGVSKSCAYRSAAPSSADWTFCANEDEACILAGPAQVRYGANDTYAFKDVNGSVACSNEVFGDPLFGVVKSCYYRLASSGSVELASIPSDFDVDSLLVPSWGTGAIAPRNDGDVVGAFRFICNPGQILADDPIVYPGQPGRSHLHQFFGNTAANASSTYQTLRTTGESTCNNMLNRSAYWIPAMMNGKGKVVRPDYISIYYKRRPADDPMCLRIAAMGCRDLPRGLRYVFGYNMAIDRGGGFKFDCIGTGATRGSYRDIVEAATYCPSGTQLGAITDSPACWDGKRLDSPDHRSHMAYAAYVGQSYAQCPSTHPYLVPEFHLGAFYTTDDDLDRSGEWTPDTQTWHFSSDVMPGMTPKRPGTTFHADWFGAWDDSVMKMWGDHCINRFLNCSGGDLGNGRQLRMFDGFRWTADPRVVDPPST